MSFKKERRQTFEIMRERIERNWKFTMHKIFIIQMCERNKRNRREKSRSFPLNLFEKNQKSWKNQF